MSGPSTVLYTTAFADAVGGGQVSLLLLLAKLDRTRFAPLVLVPGEGEVARGARALGCAAEVFEFPPLKQAWRIPGAVLRLRRLLRERGVKLVHAEQPRQALYALWARAGTNVGVIWHIRTMLHDRLDAILERGVDRIILVAGALSERFSGAGRRKAAVVHNGIDDALPPEPDRAGLPRAGEPLVLCAGRLEPDKGQHLLLEAAARLSEEFPSLGVWLVGRGAEDYTRRLESLAKPLDGRVGFLGRRDDALSLMTLCDAVVLSSTHEAFPRVLLEAMVAGRPVVASSVGGVPEAVVDGETGLLVRPGDSAALAEALGKLLRDRGARERMGEAARRRAALFSAEATARGVAAVYDEELRRRNLLR